LQHASQPRHRAAPWHVQRESLQHEVSCRITHHHSPLTPTLSPASHAHPRCVRTAHKRAKGVTVRQCCRGRVATWHAWQPHRCCPAQHRSLLSRLLTHEFRLNAIFDWNRANQALVPTIATKIIYSYGCSSCSTGAGASSYSDGSSLRWHIHTDHMPTHIHAQSFTQLTKKDAENLPATYEYQ
jgi:hypothetical protein